jgi:hypothetical protein
VFINVRKELVESFSLCFKFGPYFTLLLFGYLHYLLCLVQESCERKTPFDVSDSFNKFLLFLDGDDGSFLLVFALLEFSF